MTIIREVCFCANDHEGCYAILHRAHLVGLSSSSQLRVDVPAQELLRLGFDHVLREPRNIYAQQLRRCVRIDAFPIHSESHQRPPLVQVLPQANAKTRPGALRRSYQAFLIGVSILCRSCVDPVYPECVSQKARNHLPKVCFLARNASHVARPPHCTPAMK